MTRGLRKVWFGAIVTPSITSLSANPSMSNSSMWAPSTGGCFLREEGADHAVFFPLWHKEEYFTRTGAPRRGPRKKQSYLFSSAFPLPSHAAVHNAHMVFATRGLFSSCFKQILKLWLDFLLVLRQSTSVGVKQVIGTSLGPVWWSRATCQ